jgi:hypothetical protein
MLPRPQIRATSGRFERFSVDSVDPINFTACILHRRADMGPEFCPSFVGVLELTRRATSLTPAIGVQMGFCQKKDTD